MKITPICALALLFALPASAFQQDDAARLVPGAAVLVMRVESLETAAARIDRMRAVIAPNEAPVTAATLLEDVPVDLTLVDLGAPLTVAVEFPQTGPITTVILRSADPRALVASVTLPERTFEALVSGSFVGLRLQAPSATAYAFNESPGRTATGHLPGLCSVRVDLEQVIETWRPMIDMGLEQAEAMLDSGAFEQDVPFEMSDFMEVYFQFLHDFLDSAEVLDLAVEMRGSTAELALELSLLEQSPLSEYALAEKVDWRQLASRVDGQAAMQMVASMDTAGWLQKLLPMYESMVEEMLPGNEPATAALRAYIARLRNFTPLLGRTYAVSADLGEPGMRVDGFYGSPDPKGLLKAWHDLASDPAVQALGVRTSPIRTEPIDGVAVSMWDVGLDLDALLAALPKRESAELDLAALTKRWAQKLIGPGQTHFLALATEQGLLFAGGPDQANLASAFKRVRNPSGKVPASLERPVSRLAGANPGLLVHYDFGRVMKSFVDVALEDAEGSDSAAIGIQMQALTLMGDVLFYGGFTAQRMIGGISTDLDELAQWIAELTSAPESSDPEPKVREDFERLASAIEEYRMRNGGALPEELSVLVTPDANGAKYLEQLPADPWGRPYLYSFRPEGKGFQLSTLGRDGRPGGDGLDADIASE